jgi:hypothetical protein
MALVLVYAEAGRHTTWFVMSLIHHMLPSSFRFADHSTATCSSLVQGRCSASVFLLHALQTVPLWS